IGPVRLLSKREVCWSIKGCTNGYHRLVFHVGEQTGDKEMAIGGGFMRVSTLRPGWRWYDCLLYPAEKPFGPESAIQSIEIDYPKRSSWTTGSDSWVIYWFLVSMVAALCLRPVIRVNV